MNDYGYYDFFIDGNVALLAAFFLLQIGQHQDAVICVSFPFLLT
jgi:hypothetical protein